MKLAILGILGLVLLLSACAGNTYFQFQGPVVVNTNTSVGDGCWAFRGFESSRDADADAALALNVVTESGEGQGAGQAVLAALMSSRVGCGTPERNDSNP